MTKEEIEKYQQVAKYFKDCRPLWELKVGDVVTQEHVDSIFKLLGKAPKGELLATIHFDHLGQPYTLNDDVIKVSGKL